MPTVTGEAGTVVVVVAPGGSGWTNTGGAIGCGGATSGGGTTAG